MSNTKLILFFIREYPPTFKKAGGLYADIRRASQHISWRTVFDAMIDDHGPDAENHGLYSPCSSSDPVRPSFAQCCVDGGNRLRQLQ